MEYGSTFNDISSIKWDFAFYGNIIDERCNIAVQYISKEAKECKSITYNADESKIYFNNSESYWADDIQDYLIHIGICSSSRILLECSSLGVAELLIMMQAIKDIGCNSFDSLYLEPKQYSKYYLDFTERHHFNLSTEFEGFKAIPGHALAFEKGDKVVILCGYESERIGRAFEETAIQGRDCQLLFGMPPYIIGWDMNSYTNHLPVIDSCDISTEFYYVGAANPLSVCECLEKVYNGIDKEQKLFIFPFGTKPMSLGACLFKITHDEENLSFMYDHPKRRKNRTKDIARWNLYRIWL